MGVLVELAGLPGAGKTALAHAAIARLHAAGVACPDLVPLRAGKPVDAGAAPLARKLAATGAALLRAPGVALACARFALALADRAAGLERALVAAREAAFQDSLRGVHALALLDEGLVQCAWSIGAFASPPAEGALESLARALWPRAGERVVLLDAQADTAAQRLVARRSGHGRLDALPPEQVRAILQRQRAPLARLAALAAERGGQPLFTLSAERSLDENAARLADWIRSA